MAQKTKHTWIVGLIAVVILGLIGYAMFKPAPVDDGGESNTSNIGVWAKGPADAAVTLVEFADFQCPACSSYQPIISELAEQFPDDLRVEFRHFPLTSIHSNAVSSSRATEAAGMQGKFWEIQH